MVLDVAIVSHVTGRHQEVVIADPGEPLTLGSSPVDGDTLTEGVAVADLQPGRLSLVAEILGSAADHRAGIDHVLPAKNSGALHHSVLANPTPSPHRDGGSDDRAGRKLDAFAELGGLMNPASLELPVTGNFFSSRISHSSSLGIRSIADHRHASQPCVKELKLSKEIR